MNIWSSEQNVRVPLVYVHCVLISLPGHIRESRPIESARAKQQPIWCNFMSRVNC